MRWFLAIAFLFSVSGALAGECTPEQLARLAAKIGAQFWSAPEKRLVRATFYQKARGVSAKEGIGLRYASPEEAGTLGVPRWLPRGSMVKIHTNEGVLSYVAADEGSGVERRDAAKKLGKTKEQKAAAVLDFCAEKQAWPDFVNVDIYYYAGKVPFTDLSAEEQKTLFAYAREYVMKGEP